MTREARAGSGARRPEGGLRVFARAALACALGASGCGMPPSTAPIDFRVAAAPGDDPWTGASALQVLVEQNGTSVSDRTFPIATSHLDVGPLPFGDGFAIRVDAVGAGVTLARGLSFPFDVRDGVPTRRPDVLVGRLGAFVRPMADTQAVPSRPDTTVVGLAVTADGALLATASGSLYVYTAHAASGDASLREVAHVPDRAGARWVSMEQGRLLAVGGAVGGAELSMRTVRR